MLGADHTFSSNSAKQVAKAELKELWSPDMTSCLPSTIVALKKCHSRERWSAGCWDGHEPGDHGPLLPRLSTLGSPFGENAQTSPVSNCKKRLLFDQTIFLGSGWIVPPCAGGFFPFVFSAAGCPVNGLSAVGRPATVFRPSYKRAGYTYTWIARCNPMKLSDRTFQVMRASQEPSGCS